MASRKSWVSKTLKSSARNVRKSPERLGFVQLEDRVTPAGSDALAAATVIPVVGPYSDNGSTAGFTGEAGEVAHDGVINSAWYQITPTTSGVYTFDLTTGTTNYDTVLGVWTGAAHPLTKIAFNDDFSGTKSKLSVSLTAGTKYSVGIDGFGGATGNYTLVVGYPVPPSANDNFANATNIVATPFTETVNISGNTSEVGEVGGSSPIKSAWWK
jgi:hypothetical protein